MTISISMLKGEPANAAEKARRAIGRAAMTVAAMNTQEARSGIANDTA